MPTEILLHAMMTMIYIAGSLTLLQAKTEAELICYRTGGGTAAHKY